MYSQKTDVWSYGEIKDQEIRKIKDHHFPAGIMCWEILHNGVEPYPDLTIPEMIGKVGTVIWPEVVIAD